MAGRTAVASDATAEASAVEVEAATKASIACRVVSDESATVTSSAVGMAPEAVPALATVERVVRTDCKLPFPGELKAGFLGKLVAPKVALMVLATAAVINV